MRLIRNELEAHALGYGIGLSARRGDVICFVGAFHVGKTTIARGIIDALGHTEGVGMPHPAHEFKTGRIPVIHYDLYLWGQYHPVWDKEHIHLVEHADKSSEPIPENAIWIYLEDAGNGTRKLEIKRGESWIESSN